MEKSFSLFESTVITSGSPVPIPPIEASRRGLLTTPPILQVLFPSVTIGMVSLSLPKAAEADERWLP